MNELRFAVLGHPIAHSLSPALHRAAFAELGLPHVYEAIDVADEAELAARVDDLREGRIAGANVTVPYKVKVLSMVDEIAESARSVLAANTLVCERGRVVAHNTDIAGLADDLKSLGAAPRQAAIIGAGGAALASAEALRSLGARTIAVTSRSFTDARAIEDSPAKRRLAKPGVEICPFPTADEGGRWCEIAEASEVIVQATPAGMRGIGSGEAIADVIPWARLRRDALAYDLVYNPPKTPFLQRAEEAGIRAEGGLGMLARQGALALTLWLNVSPDIANMQRAAERVLNEVST